MFPGGGGSSGSNGGDAAGGGSSDMMLLSFEEFKAVMDEFDVRLSTLGSLCLSCSLKQPAWMAAVTLL